MEMESLNSTFKIHSGSKTNIELIESYEIHLQMNSNLERFFVEILKNIFTNGEIISLSKIDYKLIMLIRLEIMIMKCGFGFAFIWYRTID
jgi:hypothetical protein